MKDNSGCNNRDHGDKINIHTRFDRPQDTYRPIPTHKTERGGTHSQKEKVECIADVYESVQSQLNSMSKSAGHKKQSVEKTLRVALRYYNQVGLFFHYDRVKSPNNGGTAR